MFERSPYKELSENYDYYVRYAASVINARFPEVAGFLSPEEVVSAAFLKMYMQGGEINKSYVGGAILSVLIDYVRKKSFQAEQYIHEGFDRSLESDVSDEDISHGMFSPLMWGEVQALPENERVALEYICSNPKQPWGKSGKELGLGNKIYKVLGKAFERLRDTPAFLSQMNPYASAINGLAAQMEYGAGNVAGVNAFIRNNSSTLIEGLKLPVREARETFEMGLFIYRHRPQELQRLVTEYSLYVAAAAKYLHSGVVDQAGRYCNVIYPEYRNTNFHDWFRGGRATGVLPRQVHSTLAYLAQNPDSFNAAYANEFIEFGLGELIALSFLNSGPKSGIIAGSIHDKLHFRVPKNAVGELGVDSKKRILDLKQGKFVASLSGMLLDVNNLYIATILERIAYGDARAIEVLRMLPESTKTEFIKFYLAGISNYDRSARINYQIRTRAKSQRTHMMKWINEEMRERVPNNFGESYLSMGAEAVLYLRYNLTLDQILSLIEPRQESVIDSRSIALDCLDIPLSQ